MAKHIDRYANNAEWRPRNWFSGAKDFAEIPIKSPQRGRQNYFLRGEENLQLLASNVLYLRNGTRYSFY